MPTFHGPELAAEAISNLRMAANVHPDEPQGEELAANMRQDAQTYATLALAAATLAAKGDLTDDDAALWAAGLDPGQRGVQ